MPTDKLQIQSNSLADILVKLMQSQLNSININIGLLSKLFQLMSNFALAPDTLSVICKVSVYRVYVLSVMYGKYTEHIYFLLRKKSI